MSSKDIIECADAGIIDYDEMQERVAGLIDALPKELRPVAAGKGKADQEGRRHLGHCGRPGINRGTKGMKRRALTNV